MYDLKSYDDATSRVMVVKVAKAAAICMFGVE